MAPILCAHALRPTFVAAGYHHYMTNLVFFWHPCLAPEVSAQSADTAPDTATLARLSAWHAVLPPALLVLPAGLPDLAGLRARVQALLPGWQCSVCELPADNRAAGVIAAAHALSRGARAVVALGSLSCLPAMDALSLGMRVPVLDWREAIPDDAGDQLQALVAAPTPQDGSARLRLAYVSPMPPERTGVADYSANLVRGLQAHFDVDIFCGEPEASQAVLGDAFVCRPYSALPDLKDHYQRVYYHLGNSHFHTPMWPLLRAVPGVALLHDFFMGDALYSVEAHGEPGVFLRTLLQDYGPAGAAALLSEGYGFASARFPVNAGLLPQLDGVVVHSTHARDLIQQWFRGMDIPVRVSTMSYVERPRSDADRAAARARLGYGPQDFVVCSFGFLGHAKLNRVLFDAWMQAGLDAEVHAQLAFVGGGGGAYGSALTDDVSAAAGASRMRITGYTSADAYQDYLLAADVAVQLRAHSRGESSATVLDCLARGIPTVLNAHGSAAEVPADVVVRLPDQVTATQIAQALLALRAEPHRAAQLSARALAFAAEHLAPARVAATHAEALLSLQGPGRTRLTQALTPALGALLPQAPSAPRSPVSAPDDVAAIASAWAGRVIRNQPEPRRGRLLIDVSLIAESDLRTGIERVTRNLARHILNTARPDLWPELVRLVRDGESSSLWRAGHYATQLCAWPQAMLDEPLRIEEGDCLLMLDTSWGHYEHFTPIFTQIRERGGRVVHFIHDLLPIELPDCFPPGMRDMFERWMDFVVAQSDGVICVSRASAEAVSRAAQGRRALLQRPLRIGFSHNGADIREPNAGSPALRPELVALASAGVPLYLMVGTLEPRKGHDTVLAAFEQLWAAGTSAALCLIGKEGWMMGPLAERLRTHPEAGRRLLWIPSASDAELMFAYESACGVIVASLNEGFGLPIIEAAQYGKPVIATDIPVFREVAGEGANYFPVGDAPALAALITHELAVPSVLAPIHWLSWEQSAQSLLNVLHEDNWLFFVDPV